MNIKIAKSSYKNKDNKRAIIFDCSAKNYRKKINTGVFIDGEYFENEKFPIPISLTVTVSKLKRKREDADGGSNKNILEYVTIASTGNATDFGDLTSTRNSGCGLSDTHGGLEG